MTALKRILCALMTGILVFAMAGCTTTEGDEATTENNIVIPDPTAFFNANAEDVEVTEKEGQFTYWASTSYATLDMIESYVQLLISDYNFTQEVYNIYSEDPADPNGSGVLVDADIELSYNNNSEDGYVTISYFHNVLAKNNTVVALECSNYTVEDVESYAQGNVTIILPNPDDVFGVPGDWSDYADEVQYTLDSDAQEDAESFIELLLSDYGLEMISKEYDYDSSEVADYLMTAELAPDGDISQGEITIIAATIDNGDDYIYVYLSNLSADAEVVWSDSGSTDSSSEDSQSNGSVSTAEKTLVTEALSSDSGSLSKPVSDAMDLLYYAQQEMTLGDASASGTSMVRDFKGNAADYDVLCAYVELLCDKYDFELVADPHYKEGSTYTFIEFVLNYTGSKNMTGSGIKGVYTDNVGDVMIYAEIKRDTLKGAMWYDSALEPGNDGYVYGSSSGGSSYIGDSFAAGLYRLADGSFQTTDGRLTAAVGEAMMITDGSSTTYESDYIYDNDDNRQEIYVENKYGTEQQVVYIPTTVTLATDQIYDSSYFIIESNWATNTRGIESKIPPYTWTAMFACLHDGNYIYPVRGLSGVMTDVNMRVMYVDESIAVFYTCAQFESEPYEVETLIAVPIGLDTVAENQPDGEYTISVGSYVDISGPYEYDTGYDLWSWEFVYGDSLATLTGENAQICRITGTSAGEIRVRVTYSYSVKEPDVLTGIERSVSHSTSQEFVVTIK